MSHPDDVTADGRCYHCNRKVHLFVECRAESGFSGVSGRHKMQEGYAQDERVSFYLPGSDEPVVSMGIYHVREFIRDLEDAEHKLTIMVEQLLVDVADEEREQ